MQSYKDFEVYKRSYELALSIHKLTLIFPSKLAEVLKQIFLASCFWYLAS